MIDPYRWACAIVRLAKLRSHGEVRLAGPAGFEVCLTQIPVCRCCGDPLDGQRWLNGIVRGYEFELAWMLATEDRTEGVLAPPRPPCTEGESCRETK